MVKYKYHEPKINDKIVFLVVIKHAHWIDNPKRICPELPVGTLTWCYERYLDKDAKGIYSFRNDLAEEEDRCIIIENNRYMMNFDPICFEIQHTSNQKIRK